MLANSSFKTNKQLGAFSFAAFGDAGGGTQAQKDIASRVAAASPDFIVMTGDVVYPSGADADYDSKYFNIYNDTIDNICVFPSLGNHDILTDNGQPYLDNFYLPNSSSGSERYYSFDYSNAHFAVVDTNINFSPGSAQHAWLDSDLASTSKQWKFVFFHHPPYTIGPHNNDSIVATLRSDLVPLLESHGVDLVFSGHDHLYMRSEPINNVTYIVTGAGGDSLYIATPENYTAAYLNSTFSFTNVALQGSTLTLEQIRQDGTVFETHTITKPSSAAALFQLPPAPTGRFPAAIA
ncbi:MAG TPA: metallophosphoesterase, partial [Methylophilaceae bacterium]|nr:metallophosphoesterase [Methylophilaceae bacterium]